VVRKKRKLKTSDKSNGNQSTLNTPTSNVFKTGISSSGGSGSGTGSGSGYGSGGGGFGFSSPYSYYFDILRNKISSSWYSSVVSPGLRGKYIVVVNFRILRNGKMNDLKLEKRSRIETLDQSALRAIENASPFPPLPNDYPDRYLIVHFEFIWEK
jgi:TonB family protein